MIAISPQPQIAIAMTAIPPHPQIAIAMIAISPHPYIAIAMIAIPPHPQIAIAMIAIPPHPQIAIAMIAISPHPYIAIAMIAIPPHPQIAIAMIAISPHPQIAIAMVAISPYPHIAIAMVAISPHPHIAIAMIAISPHPQIAIAMIVISSHPQIAIAMIAISSHPHIAIAMVVVSPHPQIAIAMVVVPPHPQIAIAMVVIPPHPQIAIAMVAISPHPQIVIAMIAISSHPQIAIAMIAKSPHPQIAIAMIAISPHPQIAIAMIAISPHPQIAIAMIVIPPHPQIAIAMIAISPHPQIAIAMIAISPHPQIPFMASWLFIFGLVAAMDTVLLCHACTMMDTVCEFFLEVDHRLTMMRNGDLVYPKDGQIYKYDVTDTSNAIPINVDDVITADGWESPRLTGAVNGKMPGPPIIVYEGQIVIVHVTNKLINEGLTIHWHGLYQKGTPWMDGVPFVTQCPILPGQTFTYKFKAEPKGTHWYHSHLGTQRTMGIFGALIIRERKYHKEDEHIMSITEYNHDMDSLLSYVKDKYGLYEGRTPVTPSKAIDGTQFDKFQFHSGLINGRGRFYDPKTGNHNGAPLEVFNVFRGRSYRFRVIGAGNMLAFRISVDHHSLLLVASDGHDLEPVKVESFIINPGESFDFVLVANQAVSNYWIRAHTLEIDKNHRTEAILRYHGAPIAEPTTSRMTCSASSRCVVANCPYLLYPPYHYTDCLTFNDLNGAAWNKPPPISDVLHFEEHFLNFGIPGQNPASVNGIVFKSPTVSALTQPTEGIYSCDVPTCGEDRVCTCTHIVDITYGNVVQLVFTNMGLGKGQPHPIHLHGHPFYVMKMGYGKYDNITAKNIGENMDVNCRGNINRDESYCNKATWSDLSWLQGNVPGLNFERPPLKDTLIVPSGGYAVVRFRADNPGLWLMHCHMEHHHLEGMRLLLNEAIGLVPTPPIGFPECRNFP